MFISGLEKFATVCSIDKRCRGIALSYMKCAVEAKAASLYICFPRHLAQWVDSKQYVCFEVRRPS